MVFQLVVLKPFLGFARGDRVSDQKLVEKILSGPQASFVVRIAGKEA
jgi:hypothetical protein